MNSMADKGVYRISKYDELFPISGRVQEYFEKFEAPLDITIEVAGADKTNSQLKYVHTIIDRYLTRVLFDSGNIEASSAHLSKEWIKECCGYGAVKTFKFKGVERERFLSKSFSRASAKQMSEIIDEIIRICGMVGVNVEDYNE